MKTAQSTQPSNCNFVLLTSSREWRYFELFSCIFVMISSQQFYYISVPWPTESNSRIFGHRRRRTEIKSREHCKQTEHFVRTDWEDHGLMSVEEVAVEIQDADELLYMLTVESKFRQIRKLIQISQPATRNLRTFDPAFCASVWTDLLFSKFCITFHFFW